MKFQLVSDIHLEFGIKCDVKKAPEADALVLAGDIGDPTTGVYSTFIATVAARYKIVFVACGNHECYGRTLDETYIAMDAVCKKHPNVLFLNDSSVDVGQYLPEEETLRVVGTTLWSNIEDDQRSDVTYFLADFRRIREWSVDKNNARHAQAVAFIECELCRAMQDGMRVLVISHHAPHTSETSRPEHRGSPVSSAFATDLKHLLRPPVVAWAYGHTHHSNMQMVGDVLLISNQRGYYGERCGFDPRRVFYV